MTTTARVSATTAASTAYAFSVAAGVTAVFSASGLSAGEAVTFECADSSGGYAAIKYFNAGADGKASRAQGITARLTKEINVIAITGPIDARINKPVTLLSAEVVEYT